MYVWYGTYYRQTDGGSKCMPVVQYFSYMNTSQGRSYSICSDVCSDIDMRYVQIIKGQKQTCMIQGAGMQDKGSPTEDRSERGLGCDEMYAVRIACSLSVVRLHSASSGPNDFSFEREGPNECSPSKMRTRKSPDMGNILEYIMDACSLVPVLFYTSEDIPLRNQHLSNLPDTFLTPLPSIVTTNRQFASHHIRKSKPP